MKEAFFAFVVAVLCIIFFPRCMKSCDEKEGVETSCAVEWIWTLDGEYKPVWRCTSHPIDASVE